MFPFNDRHYWKITAVCGGFPVIAVIFLMMFLLFQGSEALGPMFSPAIFSDPWLPFEGQLGIMPLLVGTLATTLGALLLSLPIGMGVAYHLALYSNYRQRRLVDTAVAILAGLPSVIIGLWGMTWLLPIFGNSFASATLVLTLMILPTFTLLAGAAIRQVPRELVETLRSLGVPEVTVIGTMMRHAAGSLGSAAVLAAGRGLGEAVALSMVAGNVPVFPKLQGPVSTLTTTLITEYDGSVGQHRAALFLLALGVVALIALTSIAARAARARSRS